MENEQKKDTAFKNAKSKVEPKPPFNEEMLKEAINNKYNMSNQYYKVVLEAVDNMTERFKKPIIDLIRYADESLKLVVTHDSDGGRKAEMVFALSDEELEFLAVKIPITCLYVQEFVNDRALDVAITEYIAEDAITERLKEISGGDAKTRLRLAQQQAEIEQLVSIIKKQVHANLKTYVERADKIYEGVKKVLDGRNKEKNIFVKSNRFSS